MSRRIELAAREALLRRRHSLLGLRYELESQEAGVMADREADPIDHATARGTADFLESLSEAEHRELALVHGALARIESGTFGVCTACGLAIGHRRLEAIPWTPHCRGCAARLERRGTMS